jgi:hypothetical protein
MSEGVSRKWLEPSVIPNSVYSRVAVEPRSGANF